MAPEVANDLVEPNAASDRFSLAVLLFFIFVIGHPLKGKRELTLPYDASDPDQSHRLCALDPVFIFDPDNDSNRPQPGVHDNPLSFWPIYPGSLRKLFIRAFTAGLHDPDARVMENEWRKEMCALRDAIFHCPQCGAENFFDLELLRQRKALDPCWGCQSLLRNPPRMRMGAAYGSQLVMLSPGRATLCPSPGRGHLQLQYPVGRSYCQPSGIEKSFPRAMDRAHPEWLSDGSEVQRGAAPGGRLPHPFREDGGRSTYQLSIRYAILRHFLYTKPVLGNSLSTLPNVISSAPFRKL